jgi:septum site-determining protein MinC
MSSATTPHSIEFHRTSLGVVIVSIDRVQPAGLADDMHKLFGGRPNAFDHEAAILDFARVTELPAKIDWNGITSLMRRFSLQPIGVKNLADTHLAAARHAGLATLDHAVGEPPAPAPHKTSAPAPAPALEPPAGTPTLYIDRQVRSGQRVYAPGGDLVLLAGMSHGAEVIADGNIHCYGPLLGRALAGARGENGARIITTCFGAELVSIAGLYRTFEQGVPATIAGQAVIVRIRPDSSNQSITIDALQLD